MSSLTRRTFILVICRTLNFGVIVLLSPMVMVRIFEVEAYGQYREFVLYYLLIAGIVSFAAISNLIYFVPKYPEKQRQSVTHTALILMGLGTLGAVGVYAAKGIILANTSYDFILPLMLQVFFLINFDYFESYYLGKRRSDIVLYYSTARAAIRMAAIILVAWFTRDVYAVIWTLVAVEALKCVFVLAVTGRLFVRKLDRELLKEQVKYIVPLGTATSISRTNIQLSKVVVTSTLGAGQLALYSIGSYQVPLINIIRASIMDALFPDMTQASEENRIQLWKRATVVLCFIIFPLFTVFLYHAGTVIGTLFTTKYLAAVPLFRIYLFLMILQCFDMATPLRSMNRNVFFIVGSILSLVVNIGLILLLFRRIGIIAPAIAFVCGELVFTIYLARQVIRNYRLEPGKLVMYRKILVFVAGSAAALPILFAGEFIGLSPVIRAIVSSTIYLGVYLIIVTRFGIDEVSLLISKLFNIFRRRLQRAGRTG